MASIPGPAGEIRPGQRPPPGMQYAPSRWRGDNAPPDTAFPSQSTPAYTTPTSPVPSRDVQDIIQVLAAPWITWRPVVVSPGTLSGSEEFGLGSCYADGSMVVRVTIRLTTTLLAGIPDFWRFEVLWLDNIGGEKLLGDLSTDKRTIEAVILTNLWYSSEGVRLKRDQEIMVRATKMGVAPLDLEGLRLQADWIVGV